MSEDELIERYLEPNPNKPSLEEAWLKDSAISVWALAAYSKGVGGDLARVGSAYHLPLEQVEAAFAYYRRHHWLIEARLEANAG